MVYILLVVIFLIGEVLLRPLKTEFPPRAAPSQIDNIVALGGVEDQRESAAWGDQQFNEVAAALAIAHPKAHVLFSGDSGRLKTSVSGKPDILSVAVDCFVSLGINPDRIRWEDQSRNTAENARFSYEVAAPAPGETWFLVTSAFHMGRALISFKSAGRGGIIPHLVDYCPGSFIDGSGWNFVGNLEVLKIAMKNWLDDRHIA